MGDDDDDDDDDDARARRVCLDAVVLRLGRLFTERRTMKRRRETGIDSTTHGRQWTACEEL